MVDPKKKRYVYMMLAVSGAIGISLILFFVLYKMQGIGDALGKLSEILAPFIYGSVLAYLLRPLCNAYEDFFSTLLGPKRPRLAGALAVALSLVSGILIVYALIIMIAPQLYESILSLWNSLPVRTMASHLSMKALPQTVKLQKISRLLLILKVL
jgi:predicted PurR-regulated permease PerM